MRSQTEGDDLRWELGGKRVDRLLGKKEKETNILHGEIYLVKKKKKEQGRDK